MLALSDSGSVIVIMTLKFFWIEYFAISEVATTRAPVDVEKEFTKAYGLSVMVVPVLSVTYLLVTVSKKFRVATEVQPCAAVVVRIV